MQVFNTVVSDDPNFISDPTTGQADLCGESVTQSGIRVLVTDTSSGTPVPVPEVDTITIVSKGKKTPSPINLRFTDQPVSSATICGKIIDYHVGQETLPATYTTGSNPKSSYTAGAKEGNLQTSDSFPLGQCEFREFQLQLKDSDSQVCLLAAKGEPCETDGECCSGKCKGKAGAKVCR